MACHVRTGCSHAPKGTAVSQAAPLPPVMRSRALPSRGGPGGGTKRLPETIRHTNGAKSLPRTAPCPCRQQFAPQTSVTPQGHGQQGPGSTRGLGSGGSLSATPPSCRPPPYPLTYWDGISSQEGGHIATLRVWKGEAHPVFATPRRLSLFPEVSGSSLGQIPFNSL